MSVKRQQRVLAAGGVAGPHCRPCLAVSAVARTYNIAPGQLYQGRKNLKTDGPSPEPGVMRKGFQGLAAVAQLVLQQDPLSGRAIYSDAPEPVDEPDTLVLTYPPICHIRADAGY